LYFCQFIVVFLYQFDIVFLQFNIVLQYIFCFFDTQIELIANFQTTDSIFFPFLPVAALYPLTSWACGRGGRFYNEFKNWQLL